MLWLVRLPYRLQMITAVSCGVDATSLLFGSSNVNGKPKQGDLFPQPDENLTRQLTSILPWLLQHYISLNIVMNMFM